MDIFAFIFIKYFTTIIKNGKIIARWNMKDIIEKLKTEKSNKKITNAKLSEMSGVPLGTVNKILSGATKSIKAETLNKLKLALLLDGDDVNAISPINTYGFCKVGAYTPEIVLASPEDNANRIIDGVKIASEKGVSLLVFPKLCLTGATLGSLYYQQALIIKAGASLLEIAKATKNLPVISVIGMPINADGKLYSVGAVIYKGSILGFVPENNSDNKVFSTFNGAKTIDFFGEFIPFGDLTFTAENANGLTFKVAFSTDLFAGDIKGDTTLLAVLSATPETVCKTEKIKNLIFSLSYTKNSGLILSEAGYGESSTDCVYSGENFICERGKLLASSKKFTSGLTLSEIDVDYLTSQKQKIVKTSEDIPNMEVFFDLQVNSFTLTRNFEKTPFVLSDSDKMQERAELILNIQANGLKRRVEHTHAKALVIGVSGGLDSTLALLVAVRTMKLLSRPLKDIIAITLPCFGTSSRTKNNAYDLCSALGITLKEINIKNAVNQHFLDIGQDEGVHDVTFENSQARERTQVLMDYANKVGGLVIGTGDLSELALGWATYNGDHMSNYGVNSSIPKTLVRSLVEYESSRGNALLKKTLYDVLDTPVSPELVPPKEGEITQKTEDIVGPYILHDFYLYHAIKRCSTPSKIFYIAKNTFKNEFSEKTLYKWLVNFYKRFFAQQFKRSCLPDGVKVGSISLSPRGDFSMPSDAYSTAFMKDLEGIDIGN